MPCPFLCPLALASAGLTNGRINNEWGCVNNSISPVLTRKLPDAWPCTASHGKGLPLGTMVKEGGGLLPSYTLCWKGEKGREGFMKREAALSGGRDVVPDLVERFDLSQRGWVRE